MRLALREIYEKTKFGELILINYPSRAIPAVGVIELMTWARGEGFGVLVVDGFDTLKVYSDHAKLMGLDTEICKEVDVIKIGGRWNIGRILERIQVGEESVLESESSRLLERFYNESKKTVTIVIGASKIFAVYSEKDSLALVNFILGFVGDKRRKTFYFMNKDMMARFPLIHSMFEEISTTVVDITQEQDSERLKVTKAINPELYGYELEIKPQKVLPVLSSGR